MPVRKTRVYSGWGKQSRFTRNHDQIVAALRKHFGDSAGCFKGKKVLDLGCGTGQLAMKLQLLGAEVHAVDAIWANVAETRRRGVTSATRCDAEAISRVVPPRLKFDAVVSSQLLTSTVMQPAKAKRVLAAAASVTAPGGIHVHFGSELDTVTCRSLESKPEDSRSFFGPQLRSSDYRGAYGLSRVALRSHPQYGDLLVLKKPVA